MDKLNWVNILARHLGCKLEDLPSIDVVFQEFENLQHDCIVYSQSGFIHIDHTVH